MHASKTGPHLTKTQKYEAIAELRALGVTDLTPERLEEVENPEVACLLLQAEVATVIPDGFLRESSLTRLDLSAVSFVTQIGDNFLEECTSLTSVDLSGLSNVTLIGSHFLWGCNSLPTLDLTPLHNVTRIGICFLDDNSLTTLDLTPLSNVTRIEGCFLHGCNFLSALDLTPLDEVEYVGLGFAMNCTSLTSIYLSGCSSAVSDAVREREDLKHLVVEARPKRSRDESPDQAHKRQRHAQ